jgi:hypothetical protein
MLEFCQILLICLTLAGVGLGAVLLTRASLTQLAGVGKIALEGCVRLNASWLDELAPAWSLVSWNSVRRPPPYGEVLSGSGIIRAVGVSWGPVVATSPPLAPRRL